MVLDIIANYPKRKLETILELQAPAHEFYNCFKKQPFLLSDHAPTLVLDVTHHHDEDNWDAHGHGSIKTWTYTLGGKTHEFKERVELDDEHMMVRLVGIEGEPFNYYKHFEPVFQVTPNPKADGKGCLAKLTILYETINEEIQAPNYMEIMIGLTKDISDGIVKKA